jgi:hypothetical protein
MPTDIKLDENIITLEGFRIIAQSADLCLDLLERRPGTDPNALRRALVHTPQDGLTINWDSDYPGGVNILGSVSIPGELSSNGKLSLNGRLLLNIEEPPKEEVPGGFIPVASGPSVSSPIGLTGFAGARSATVLAEDPFKHLQSDRSPIDLAREILILRQLISNLNERVKDLETK